VNKENWALMIGDESKTSYLAHLGVIDLNITAVISSSLKVIMQRYIQSIVFMGL
jgi:hypothetical protein